MSKADGDKLTYLVDQSDGATASGLSSAQTEGAIDRALDTWQANRCFGTVDIVKRGDSGGDSAQLDPNRPYRPRGEDQQLPLRAPLGLPFVGRRAD